MRRLLIPAAVAALVLALAAPALAAPDPKLIRLGKGLSGLSLGETMANVRKAKGNPRSEKRGTNDFGPYTEWRFAGKLLVTFQGNTRVTNLSTTDREQRTTTGIGVGSTEMRAREKIRGLRCETVDDRRSCFIGRFRPGEAVTTFFLNSRGKINRVDVGIVQD